MTKEIFNNKMYWLIITFATAVFCLFSYLKGCDLVLDGGGEHAKAYSLLNRSDRFEIIDKKTNIPVIYFKKQELGVFESQVIEEGGKTIILDLKTNNLILKSSAGIVKFLIYCGKTNG